MSRKLNLMTFVKEYIYSEAPIAFPSNIWQFEWIYAEGGTRTDHLTKLLREMD